MLQVILTGFAFVKIVFFKWTKHGLFLFILFFSQCTNLTINDNSIDGLLGSRTWGGRMEGADESTELWRHAVSI